MPGARQSGAALSPGVPRTATPQRAVGHWSGSSSGPPRSARIAAGRSARTRQRRGTWKGARRMPRAAPRQAAGGAVPTAAAGEAPFYIPATERRVAAAPQPQAQRHLRRVRQPRRHRRERRRRRRPVRLRHALPLAPRAADQRRRSPCCCGSAISDDNLSYPRRPRPIRTSTPTMRDRRCSKDTVPHRAHHLPVRQARLRERIALIEPRRRSRSSFTLLAGVRQRLRRHLRGARHQRAAARPDLERRAGRRRRRALATAGSTGACAETTLQLRAGADHCCMESVADLSR